MSILSAKHLKKIYKSRTVVSDVSLTVKTGEVVGLLGPNGAGKTTSFYMLMGSVRADGGQVCLNDQDITQLPMHKRAKLGIGYLPQEKSIFRKLSVEDNIMAILQLRSDLKRKTRQKVLDRLLSEFRLEHIRKAPAISLSGGETRRVEIARALAVKPKFILLDEPFAGIDPISIIDIKQMISQLAERGIGVLITDHNVRETLQICQHAYIVSEGKVIAKGDTQAILNDQMVRDVYLGEEFCL